MPNRSKKIIRIISICLITALFAGVVLSTQTKVVQAAEAFLEVQRDWTSGTTESAKTFTILEVVDKKSSFSELMENGSLKWTDAYNEDSTYSQNVTSLKATIDNEITLGEEEIGYLIGQSEAFYETYNKLIQLSKKYSETKDNAKELAVIQAYYEALLEKISGQITTYKNDATINVLAPLSTIEATSFQPTLEGYDNCLRFLENVSSSVTAGFLVEDLNGVYAVASVDENNDPVSFKFVGEQTAAPTVFRLMRPLKNVVEETVSDNSVSDNSVSENSTEEKNDDSKKEVQATVSGNSDEIVTTTPSDTNGENETETPVGEDVTPKDSDDNVPETPTEGSNSSDNENNIPTVNENENNGDDDTTQPGTQTPAVPTETPTETPVVSDPTPVEPTGLPESQSQEDTEDENEIVTSCGYTREVFYGKQVLLMSSNLEGGLSGDSPTTGGDSGNASGEQQGTQDATSDKRYSFYLREEYIPEELKDKTPISVAVSNSNTSQTTDEGTDNGGDGNTDGSTSNSQAQIDAIYQYRFVGIKNNEWFKTYVFGLDATTFGKLNVQVVTCTLDESDKVDLQTYVRSADLVYWNADAKVDGDANTSTDTGKDILVDDAIALLNQITGEKSIPCIINHNAFVTLNTDGANNTITNNNINKMLHLLYQEEIEETYKNSVYGFTLAAKWQEAITDTSDDNITVWEQIKGTISILNNGHFVRDNVYVIDHAINSVTYKDPNNNNNDVLNGIKDKINGSEQEISAAFEDVVYRIEREIYERQNTSGASSWEDTTITPAVAIQTILTYSKTPAVIEKSHITVLELQPCYSFTYASGNEDAFRAKFLPENSSVEVEIIGMTTSQFCGMIEDINVKYDMIYIGSNTDLMNRIEVGTKDYCTAYNDFNMYGVVYAHTGDLCHINSHGGSLADNENHTYRYSGNDILKSQATDLLEFLQSGAPVVVADDFFVRESINNVDTIAKISTGALKTKDADGNVIDVTVDDTKRGDTATGITRNGILDSSSYVYQFVKNACVNETGTNTDGTSKKTYSGETDWEWSKRKYENFLTVSEVNATSFSRWLNQPKMSIHMLSQPTEYNYTTKKVGKSTVIDDSSYLQKDDNGYYYLTYEFYISSIASVDVNNTRYKVSLWIDTNMDGKFSDTTENLTDSELVIKNMDTGETVGREELKTGVHYRVKRKLPTEIVGAVPWKLEIKHKDNSALRNAVSGITAVRVPEKQTIRVLQLYQGAAVIETYMKEADNHWNSLMNNVPDFKVEVTSIEATAYLTGQTSIDLNHYDMLIVGFADNYQYNTQCSETVLEDIIEYAESGKCILFTHDNTNWVNNTVKNLNTTIRDISGLDRYAVSIYRNKTTELFAKNHMKDGKDVKKSSKSELIDYLFGENGLKDYDRDIAFKVNTEQTVMDSRTQGLSYSGNEHDRFAFSGNETTQNTTSPLIKDANDVTYKDIYRYLSFENADKGTWINQNNHIIEKVNVGAITEYPYRLSNTMKVSSTHGQYFQLDLDSDKDDDGEGDIVVWYTMNDSKAGELNDIYDYSPFDVRNNYYIYNRGNITYTGMGHSNIKDNEEEVKLFINTMIAAYRVAIQSPNLSIIEGHGDTTEKSFDAIPFDGNVTNNATTYNVYFKAEDVNLISESQKNVRCKIYMGGGNETININGENVNVIEKTGQAAVGWKIFDTATNTEVTVVYDNDKKEYYYPIISGKEYYIQVPLVENPGTANQVFNLSETKSLDLYIEVQSFITKNNKKNESALIYDNFKLTQINLFDLD